MSIGSRIKDALRARDRNVAALAEYLDITEQSVYRYLRDEVEPSISTIMRIADFTGFSYLYFISGKAVSSASVTTFKVVMEGETVVELPIPRGSAITLAIE